MCLYVKWYSYVFCVLIPSELIWFCRDNSKFISSFGACKETKKRKKIFCVQSLKCPFFQETILKGFLAFYTHPHQFEPN